MDHRDDTAGNGVPDWEAFYASYRKPGYVPGYEITSKLGGGQFGLVFRARKQSIGKDYAIKFLQIDDGEVRRAIENELHQLRHVAQIDHPNLVSIEDRGEVDGIPYLVMSFAGTHTLQSLLPAAGCVASGAQADELRWVFLQACRGVAALHERGLVHFDLKPANVFLKGNVARVGDYGLSKLVTQSRGSLSVGRGTPYYMAPELLQRRGDARSDVYSLGVMLYEILCGRVPFTGDSEWQVLRQHETVAPSMPEHLSDSERALLQRCLAKDPAARFQSVNDLIAAFGAPAEVAVTHIGGAAAAESGDAPECVPPLPPLPAAAEPVPAPRRSGSPVPLVVAVVCVVFFSARWTSTHREARNTVVAHTESRPERPPRQRSVQSPLVVRGGLQGELDAFVAGCQRDVRDAERRKTRAQLTEPRAACSGVPDLDRVAELVEGLADAQTFSPGHATKLELNGFATFVAGVRLLQQLDYRDARDCRRADNTSRMLAQMTGLTALVIEAPGGRPSRTDECRCRALACAWRKLADQFAADEAAYLAMLEARSRNGRHEVR